MENIIINVEFSFCLHPVSCVPMTIVNDYLIFKASKFLNDSSISVIVIDLRPRGIFRTELNSHGRY